MDPPNTRVDPNLPVIRVNQHVDGQRWKDIVKERLLEDKSQNLGYFIGILRCKR
jgi:hypothetical protein